jgi:1-acyl-sn-glycerol-3-phosphate acyltransferase
MKKYMFIKRIKIVHNDFSSIPNKPCLFIANHKGNADGFAIFISLYQHRQTHNQDSSPIMIAKKELNKKFSVVTPILDMIDTIYIDREDIRQQVMVYMKQKEYITKDKRSIVVCPEGTRIYTDKFAEFKSGALKIAFDTLSPIVPIVIYGSSGLMDSDKTNIKSGRTIYVNFLHTVQAKDYSGHNVVYFAEKLQNEMQDVYNKMNSLHKQKKEIF